jgi:hypothetical protein
MGGDYLNDSNTSYQITDEYYENNTRLRHLANSDYPYYGQKIMSTVKDVYSKSFAGITMGTYVETIVYPHNGQTIVNTISIFGSIKKTLNSQTSYTNSHIITKNKNTMAYDLINFIQNKRTEAEDYRRYAEQRLINSYPSILKEPKPYNYETLFDDFYNGILDYVQEESMTMMCTLIKYMVKEVNGEAQNNFSYKNAQALFDEMVDDGMTLRQILMDVIYETLVVSGFLEKEDWEEMKTAQTQASKKVQKKAVEKLNEI